MRIRLSHKPDDWSDNIPAAPPSTGGWFHGAQVVPDPAPIDVGAHRRAKQAEYQRRSRAKKAAGE